MKRLVSKHRKTLALLALCSLLMPALLLHTSPSYSSATPKRHALWDPENGSLRGSEAECRDAFPGLTDDIDSMVRLGPFAVRPARDMGPLQVRIQDGQMYILRKESNDVMTQETLDARLATLHQLHLAMLTSPTPLPNTIVSINVQDGPVNDTWSYTRQASASAAAPGSPPVRRAFLMPHFSGWAWPLPFVGSQRHAAAAVDAIEAAMPFGSKDSRPVWRGTKRYNSVHNPHLRTRLLEVAGGTEWADVEELRWEERGESETGGDRRDEKDRQDRHGQMTATNALLIQDFCRHKYIIHTEGITYSGRLSFHQMCASVVFTPPLAWLQHTTHLVKPLFTSDLDLDGPARTPWTPSRADHSAYSAWPTHFSPAEANMVFVAPDWSDLHETIAWLEEHADVAAGIARRQRALFVGSGYLSRAAEMCYWRALIRGWSGVARPHGWEVDESHGLGIPWELFSLDSKRESEEAAVSE